MRGHRWAERVLTAFGDRLGLSAGQSYTVATGMVVAAALLGIGLPPVVGRHVLAPAEAAAPSAPTDGEEAPVTAPAASIPVVQAPVPGAFAFTPSSPILGGSPPNPPSRPPLALPVVPLGTTTRFAAVPDPGAPAGIAVGPDGTVYVATGNAITRGGAGAGVVMSFDPTGKPGRVWTIDGMAATRSVGLTDVAVDAEGTVWVLDASTARVLRIDPGAAKPTVVATVPNRPACALGMVSSPCEPGLFDGAPELRGLAVRPQGGVYVADRVQGTIWSVDRLGAVASAVGFEDRVAGEGPVDVAVMGDGSLVATLSARLGSFPAGLPSVVRVRAKDGVFEAPEVVVDLAPADAPQSVVPTATGRVFVALSGVNEVLDIGLEQGDLVHYGPALDPAFDVPVGLALRDGTLLVTNQGGASADASRWLVLALGVTDRPPAPTTRSTA